MYSARQVENWSKNKTWYLLSVQCESLREYVVLTQIFWASRIMQTSVKPVIVNLPSKTSNIAKMMKTDTAEDLKLYLAAMESYQTGSLTPILKEELKYHIQSRRMSEGKDEMIVEFDQGVPRKQVRNVVTGFLTSQNHGVNELFFLIKIHFTHCGRRVCIVSIAC